jgi:hypothetical protein
MLQQNPRSQVAPDKQGPADIVKEVNCNISSGGWPQEDCPRVLKMLSLLTIFHLRPFGADRFLQVY